MQEFGSAWTREKVERVVEYLNLFNMALRKLDLRRIYFDAFAGTGSVALKGARQASDENQASLGLFGTHDAAPEIIEGSAIRALNLDVPFDRYVFVDLERSKLNELETKLSGHRHSDRVECYHGDANDVIREFCTKLGNRDRGVIFLDPFGTSVEWRTLEAIAKTEKLDVWLLFASGIAINRMITRSGRIPQEWRATLNRIFGDTEWEEELYRESPSDGLFGAEIRREKTGGADEIDRIFIRRLNKIFPYVAPNPLPLFNGRDVHIFSLMFCCSNPSRKAIELSKRLSGHVLNPNRKLI